MGSDSGLDRSSGNREKQMSLRSILEVEATGFDDRLAVGVRQREAIRITPKFWA